MRVAAAGPSPYAAEAAVDVAAAGGNAVDAALAASLVAMVTEPGVAAIGGGAFVTVGPPGAAAETIDGTVSMPGHGLPRERFGHGLEVVTMPYAGQTTTEVGHGAVATPGALPAFETAHRRHGRMPWREVVAPATARAREGFALGAAAARYLTVALGHIFDRDPDARAALRRPDGSPLTAGETVRIAGLADFLDRVAEEGAAALHGGDVAATLERDMAEHGGLVTRGDLARYRAEIRPSLAVRTGAWWLATNPAPAVGGAVLGAMLALLEGRWHGGRDNVADLVEVQRAVLSHRVKELDTAQDRVSAAAAMLESIAAGGPAWRLSPATVNVSVVDADGLACAVTASCGYGAGVTVPGTGVWLNNCLGERELNRRGLHALPPGERLVSNMAPTVGRRDDGAVLAIGSPGADRIATAVLQTLLPIMHEGAPLAAAVARPRLHVTCDHDGRPLFVEHEDTLPRPAGVADDVPWREHPSPAMLFGGVGVALLAPDGRLDAAADPRREGAVAITRSP